MNIQRTVYESIKTTNVSTFNPKDLPIDELSYRQVYGALKSLLNKGIIERDPKTKKFIKPKKMKNTIEKKKKYKNNSIPNTVAIHPRFSDIKKWSVKNITSHGFELLDITFSGQGSPYKNMPEIISKKEDHWKGQTVDDKIMFTLRQTLRSERIHASGHDYDEKRHIALTDYSWFSWNLHYMEIKNSSGDIFKLQNFSGIFMVKTFNGVNFTKCNLPDIEKALNTLYYQNCEWNPELRTRATVCFKK